MSERGTILADAHVTAVFRRADGSAQDRGSDPRSKRAATPCPPILLTPIPINKPMNGPD